jgi:predicted TIM-barrel fold metal-dependent hydrolase
MNPHVSLSRRAFILSQTALLCSAGQSLQAVEQAEAHIDVIDCHTHFYDPSRPQGVPWPSKSSALYRTVLPADLKALPKFHPLRGTVIVEASQWLEDNDWLMDLADADQFVVGIVGRLPLGSQEFKGHLKKYSKHPKYRGIRMSAANVTAVLESGVFTDFESLSDHDCSLDINGNFESLNAAAALAKRLPSLRIIVNHIGNVKIDESAPPADWQAAVRNASQFENVFCKISALVEGASRDGRKAPDSLPMYIPYLDVVWNAFGDRRVIYGSNWPVSESSADYETLQRIAMQYAAAKGTEAARRFCSLNAKAAYKWVG